MMTDEIKNLSNEQIEALIAELHAELKARKTASVPENATVIAIDNGYIDQSDLNYEEHARGTNWIATVSHDPSQPGGLARKFWDKGSGSYRKVPADLTIGATVEVAYDYTSGGGRRDRKRDYYKVAEVNASELTLAPATKP